MMMMMIIEMIMMLIVMITVGFGLLTVYLDDMYSAIITTPINLAATVLALLVTMIWWSLLMMSEAKESILCKL